jgi:asparagine synthase (glutamine-hydrolysing)
VRAIFGAVGLDGRSLVEEDLAGVRAVLAGLGSDGGAHWSGRVGRLGTAVGALAQPALASSPSTVLVADLRIDNRDELAASLGLPGDPGQADSEIALAAYERWGDLFLDRLVGVFALAVLDRARGSVLLARDHLGLRPFVVHDRRGLLAFSSTPHSLAAFEGVGRRLDMRRAAEVLALAYASERTFVEGVRWVAPGEAISIGPSGTRRWSWWRPSAAIRKREPPEVFDHELRTAIDLAVGAATRGAGRIGVMASGGLDSTSVAATAAVRLRPAPVTTYTSAPRPGWRGSGRSGFDPDESPLVHDLAALHPNLSPVFVHVEPGHSLLDHHEQLWELGAGPARNPCNAIWAHEILARAAGDGVTTLLGGGFGNYFFSAPGKDWLVALLRAGHLADFGSELVLWGRATGQPLGRVLRAHVIRRMPVPALRRLRARLMRGPDRAEAWLRNTALRPEVAAEIDLPALLPQLDPARPRETRADIVAIARTASTQADSDLAAEAYFGVETRDPTADRRVVELALTQPEWVRRREGIGRAVARAAMYDRLPRSIRERRRRGEQLPEWLEIMTAARGELADELEAMAEHAPSRELIDVDRVRRLFDSWPEPRLGADAGVTLAYRHLLFRAVLVSRYMRWFEQRSRAA